MKIIVLALIIIFIQNATSYDCPVVKCDYLMQAYHQKEKQNCGTYDQKNNQWILNPCYEKICSLRATLEQITNISKITLNNESYSSLTCQYGMSLLLDFAGNEKDYINFLNSVNFYQEDSNNTRICKNLVKDNCKNLKNKPFFPSSQLGNKTELVSCTNDKECEKDNIYNDQYCQCNFQGEKYCRRLIGDDEFCPWLEYQCLFSQSSEFEDDKSTVLFIDAFTYHQMIQKEPQCFPVVFSDADVLKYNDYREENGLLLLGLSWVFLLF